jgi:hypothetical protein
MFLDRMYEEMYYNISISDIQRIERHGCRKPCNYKKYQIIGDKIPTAFKSDYFTFSIWAVSDDTTVEKEELIYPLPSLVAEFGGTLGLFLGFSFMALWDGAAKLAGWGKSVLAKGT